MAKVNSCLLLLNVGTPDSPKKKDVRKYLTQFLNDKYVIDLKWLARKILVNGIIIPFRVNTSVKIYSELWNNHGRILDIITKNLTRKLNIELQDDIDVLYAMRYGNPSINKAIEEIHKRGYENLIIHPLFPQDAMSTRETSIEEVYRIIKKFNFNINVRVLPTFFDHNLFIEGVAKRANKFNVRDYDHVLFSYHGLPNRHILKAHAKNNISITDIENCACEQKFESNFQGCYKAECYETSRLIAGKLNIPKSDYSIVFQSRLSKNWMRPFADKYITELAKKGMKKILIFTPAFVIDCLETVNEVGEEYVELFQQNGGEQLDLVPCLNDSDEMIKLTESLLYS